MEEPLVPIMFVSIKNGPETVIVKALLDYGAGALLIAEKYCNNLKTISKKASLKTVAGKFYTAGVVKTAFQLIELNSTAKIDYKLLVANSLGVYDMILGRDVLKSLGIIIIHMTETIILDDASKPMKSISAQPAESFHIEDLKGINDIVRQIAGDKYKTILKAKYEKVDLKKE
eukprot:5287678-Ditylum_brightwellii.AAC.1